MKSTVRPRTLRDTEPVKTLIGRVRAELACRRELRTMPPLDTAPYGDATAGPTLAQLRESA